MKEHMLGMHPPEGGGGGLEKWFWGVRFQKLKGDIYPEGFEYLEEQGGAKFSEGDSGGLQCFSATMLFLWQHCYKLFISLCTL